jgi:hypothetical protein
MNNVRKYCGNVVKHCKMDVSLLNDTSNCGNSRSSAIVKSSCVFMLYAAVPFFVVVALEVVEADWNDPSKAVRCASKNSLSSSSKRVVGVTFSFPVDRLPIFITSNCTAVTNIRIITRCVTILLRFSLVFDPELLRA